MSSMNDIEAFRMEAQAKQKLAKWFAGTIYGPLWDAYFRDWLGGALIGTSASWDEMTEEQQENAVQQMKDMSKAGLFECKIQIKPEGVPYPADWPVEQRRGHRAD